MGAIYAAGEAPLRSLRRPQSGSAPRSEHVLASLVSSAVMSALHEKSLRPMATPSALAATASAAGSTRPARPPRGSRVPQDPCRRDIFCGRGEVFWGWLRLCPIDRGLRPLCSRCGDRARSRPGGGATSADLPAVRMACGRGEAPLRSRVVRSAEGLVALSCCAAAEGNSFSLSRDCVGGGQLPREGAGYGKDPCSRENLLAAVFCHVEVLSAPHRPRPVAEGKPRSARAS